MQGWPTCVLVKFSSHLNRIPAKSREIPPRQASSLLIWTYYVFIRSFLKKARSHLGEPANLTGPAQFYMKCPQVVKTFIQKFDLRGRFVTLVNAFARVVAILTPLLKRHETVNFFENKTRKIKQVNICELSLYDFISYIFVSLALSKKM